MPTRFRKHPSGRIEVQFQPGDGTVLINKTFRVHPDLLIRTEIEHYLDPDKADAFFVIRNGVFTMLYQAEDCGDCREVPPDQFHAGCGNCERESRLVLFPGAVVMAYPSYNVEYQTFLVGFDGYCKGGSNVHGHGALCLGGDPNPFSISTVEMLMMNEANDDLGWRGDPMHGSWELANGIDYFKITTWPTLSERLYKPLPPAVLDALAR